MNRSAIAVFAVATIAATSGFLIGKSSGTSPQREAEVARITASSNSDTQMLELLRVGQANLSTSRFLEMLHGADANELLMLIERVTRPGMFPARMRRLYLEAIVSRIVDLGEASLLLEHQWPGHVREQVLGSVFGVLGEMDPVTGGLLFATLESADKENAVRSFLTALGEHDPAAGIAFLRAHPELTNQHYALFSAWAEKDPEAAAKAEFELSEEPGGNFPYQAGALRAWAKADPETSWEWIKDIATSSKDQFFNAYLDGLRSADPEIALKAVLEKRELQHSWTISQLGGDLVRDPEKAFALVEAVPSDHLRKQLLEGMAKNYDGDLEMAVAWADSLYPGEKVAFLSNLISNTGQEDPEAAIDLATRVLEGEGLANGIGAAVGYWLVEDFEDATAKLATRFDPDTLSDILSTAMGEYGSAIAATDEQLFGMIMKLPANARGGVLGSLGHRWAGSNNQAVFDAMRQLSVEDRAHLARGVLRVGYGASPDHVKKLLQYLSPQDQHDVAYVFSYSVAKENPGEAISMLAALPDIGRDPFRWRTLGEVMEQWTYSNPEAALAHVQTMPAGEALDRAIQAQAKSLRRFNLESATRLIQRVSDPKRRADLIRDLAGDWKAHDHVRGRHLMKSMLTDPAELEHASALFELQ